MGNSAGNSSAGSGRRRGSFRPRHCSSENPSLCPAARPLRASSKRLHPLPPPAPLIGPSTGGKGGGSLRRLRTHLAAGSPGAEAGSCRSDTSGMAPGPRGLASRAPTANRSRVTSRWRRWSCRGGSGEPCEGKEAGVTGATSHGGHNNRAAAASAAPARPAATRDTPGLPSLCPWHRGGRSCRDAGKREGKSSLWCSDPRDAIPSLPSYLNTESNLYFCLEESCWLGSGNLERKAGHA